MNREEIITRCIDDVRAGRMTVKECLDRYPELRWELKPLLEIAKTVEPVDPGPSPEFKMRAKKRLLEEMNSSPSPARFPWSSWSNSFRLAGAFSRSLAFGIAAVVLGASGVVYGSNSSLPGDLVYPVKTGIEKLQVAAARSPEARAEVTMKLARSRTDEVMALSFADVSVNTKTIEAGRNLIDASLKTIALSSPETVRVLLARMISDTLYEQGELTSTVSNASSSSHPALNETMEIVRRANIIARVSYGNPDFLKTSPSVSDKGLENSYFQVTGTFAGMINNAWQVSGIQIPGVICPQLPSSGQLVRLEGVNRGGAAYVSIIDSKDLANGAFEIGGNFQGITPDGSWQIAGLRINSPSASPAPETGKWLLVQGNNASGISKTDRIESSGDSFDNHVDGTLVRVNPDSHSIMVNVSGALVTVHTGDDRVTTSNGQSVALSDLDKQFDNRVYFRVSNSAHGVLYTEGINLESSEHETYSPPESRQDPNSDTIEPRDNTSGSGDSGTRADPPDRESSGTESTGDSRDAEYSRDSDSSERVGTEGDVSSGDHDGSSNYSGSNEREGSSGDSGSRDSDTRTSAGTTGEHETSYDSSRTGDSRESSGGDSYRTTDSRYSSSDSARTGESSSYYTRDRD